MNRHYANKRARQGADRYGTYRDGRLINAENIAGRVIDRQLPGFLNRNYLARVINESAQ